MELTEKAKGEPFEFIHPRSYLTCESCKEGIITTKGNCTSCNFSEKPTQVLIDYYKIYFENKNYENPISNRKRI